MSDDDEAVRRLTDGEGRLLRWPKRAADKGVCLRHLAGRFEAAVRYDEAEVNRRIGEWTVDGDHALLRRELVVSGFLERTPDGRAYWRARETAERATDGLGIRARETPLGASRRAP